MRTIKPQFKDVKQRTTDQQVHNGQEDQGNTLSVYQEEEMSELRFILEEKELAMEQLLKEMNLMSEKLVAMNILPAIPGLFASSANDKNELKLPVKLPVKVERTNRKHPVLPNQMVSDAIRKLLMDMEYFKLTLIQIEEIKVKLAHYQVAQIESATATATEDDEQTQLPQMSQCDEVSLQLSHTMSVTFDARLPRCPAICCKAAVGYLAY